MWFHYSSKKKGPIELTIDPYLKKQQKSEVGDILSVASFSSQPCSQSWIVLQYVTCMVRLKLSFLQGLEIGRSLTELSSRTDLHVRLMSSSAGYIPSRIWCSCSWV
jgi:hypothetical protein